MGPTIVARRGGVGVVIETTSVIVPVTGWAPTAGTCGSRVLGWVRTHESTRKLARRIETGIARIRSATVSFQRGRWHVSFSVELPDPMLAQRTSDRVIGVDLGVKSLAVLDGPQSPPGPRDLRAGSG